MPGGQEFRVRKSHRGQVGRGRGPRYISARDHSSRTLILSKSILGDQYPIHPLLIGKNRRKAEAILSFTAMFIWWMIQVCNRWNEIWENREVADFCPGVKTTKKVVKLDELGNQIQLWPRLHFQHPRNLWQSETVSRQPGLRYSRGKIYFLSHLFTPNSAQSVLGEKLKKCFRLVERVWDASSWKELANLQQNPNALTPTPSPPPQGHKRSSKGWGIRRY